jgi:electron transfer DM13
MSKKLTIALIVVVVVGAGAWYAFRPERLFINQRVNEQFPTASAANQEPMKLASGEFHAGAHETKGTATVFRLADGKKTLRLTRFETSNGPDVHVYLVAAADAKDNDTVKSAGFVDLGSLKGNIGDQNYDVPANVDLAKYRAATIWCARFNVNFGTAPLMSDSMQSMNR